MTFAATANAIVHAGGTPVIADIDRETLCISPEDIERRHNPPDEGHRPVHFAGRPATSRRSRDRRDVRPTVIEDCAHAIETTIDGRHAGTFGAFGAFSFYVTKNVVTAEGGMLHHLDADAAARVTKAVAARAQCGRLEAVLRRGVQALRGRGTRLQVQHDRSAGCPRVEATRSSRTEPRAAQRDLGPLRRRHSRSSRHRSPLPAEPGPAMRATSTRSCSIWSGSTSAAIGTARTTCARSERGIHYRAVHLHPYYGALVDGGASLANASWVSERTSRFPSGQR